MEPLFKTHVTQGRQSGPKLLITGGVHGDEFEPMMAIRRLINEVSAEQLSGTLTLISVVNESAYRNKHRFGEDGLDLARTFPGSEKGSITERVAAALTKVIGDADYFIDLHTGGTTLSVSPMSGYTLHPNEKILNKQREMARAFNLPIIWGTAPDLQGRSVSAARDADVPAIYCEYLGSAVCHEAGVDAYVAGCLNVMGMLGMIHHDPPASRVKHVVEDPRSGSGNMQVQNPAPCEGYFESHVQLGEPVVSGELLGTVCNELGTERCEIRSAQSGIVLTLKTYPRVDQGEGVAVVLEEPPS